MKTLDEVIEALEWCIDDSHDDCDGCPYDTGEVTDCHDRNVDALHYLREYRAKKEEDFRQAYIAVRNEILFGGDINEPLTWKGEKNESKK